MAAVTHEAIRRELDSRHHVDDHVDDQVDEPRVPGQRFRDPPES